MRQPVMTQDSEGYDLMIYFAIKVCLGFIFYLFKSECKMHFYGSLVMTKRLTIYFLQTHFFKSMP